MINGYKNNNSDSVTFIDQIKLIENTIKNHLRINDAQYLSQIRYSDKYDPLLITKIKSYGKQIKTQLVSNQHLSTIFDLEKKQTIRAELEVGNIWKSNQGQFVAKFVINKIEIKN